MLYNKWRNILFSIQPEWIDLSRFYENVFAFIDEDMLNQIKCNDQIKY